MIAQDPQLYLAAPPDSFWRWASDGSAIEWTDGRTIAFRQEIHAILERLAANGLPPFSALVLLLAACRDNWSQREHERLKEYWDHLRQTISGSTNWNKMFQVLTRVLQGLDELEHLLPDVRTLLRAKVVLAETMFEEGARHVDPETALAVVAQLAAPDFSPHSADLEDIAWSRAVIHFSDAMEALAEGLPRINEDRLRLRARTGLDQLPAESQLDLAPAERMRRMLAELRGDAELAGLANLAHELLAAVNVPRALTARLDLPVGGVSDISHRGPLDRLLVSELAHDDLTLAVRVATSEALYLRREAPPHPPPNRRAILLDSGIRLWGVPRVFVTAVGMALIANADAKAEIVTYRASDDGEIDAVDLTRRDGLIAHLEKLGTAAQPGAAIGAFLDAAADVPTDCIVVTHERVLSDRDFIAACSSLGKRPWHIATVARDGGFKLFSMAREGRRMVCQATLDLSCVLAPAAGPAPLPLLHPARAGDLPVIFSTEPFPLLMPYAPLPHLARDLGEAGLIALTRDGRMLHWISRALGGKQISCSIPRGQIEGFIADTDSAHAVIATRKSGWPLRRRLIIADLKSSVAREIELLSADEPATALARHHDALLLIFRKHVEAFSAQTGERIGHTPLPQFTSIQGRFIQRNGKFAAIAFDGKYVRLQIFAARNAPIAVFEVSQIDAPLMLFIDGTINSIDPGHKIRRPGMQRTVTLAGVDALNGRVVVRGSDARLYLIDLPAGTKYQHFPGDVHSLLIGAWRDTATTRGPGVRRRFAGIALSPNGTMILVTRPTLRALAIVQRGEELILSDRGEYHAGTHPSLIPFVLAEPPAGHGYLVSSADCGGGGRAFLDSRGLLHLKPASPRDPELTIALAGSGPLAGWLSDGRVFGEKYFHGRYDVSGASPIIEIIRRFAERGA